MRLRCITALLILIVVTILPAMPVFAQDPLEEVVSLRTETSKTYDLGDGTYRMEASVGAVHYRNQGEGWQDIDADYSEPDSGSFTARFDKLPYIIRMGDDGYRRIYPDRNDLSYWIDIGKPFPNMGVPVKEGGYWVWDYPNATMKIRVANEGVKLNFILKNATAPTSISFPFSVEGITRQGNLLYHNGEPAGELTKPTAEDAEGTIRDVDVSFAGGQITLSLDTTGLVFPIDIDPTWQVAGVNNDGVYHKNSVLWLLNNANSDFGYLSATYQGLGAVMRWTNITIPQGATIDSAVISIYPTGTQSATTVNGRISIENADNAAIFSTQANFDARTLLAAVDWNNVPTHTFGNWYNTPSLVTPIQAVINGGGWASGNAIVATINDWDERSTQSNNTYRDIALRAYTDGSKAPRLVITYHVSPTVTSSAATDITTAGATLHGEITDTGDSGVTTRGFEWDTDSGAPYANDWNEVGAFGLGAFSRVFSSMPPDTTIYWRAYATNTGGTGYSAERNFDTLPDAPTNFTLTDLGATGVRANWTSVSTYTMLRAARDAYPTTPSEGELIYYGSASSDNTTGYALETTTYYWSAWGFASDNVTYSANYATASIGGDDMVTLASNFFFLVLLLAALGLTIAMVGSKNAMLGFPAAIFWAILGGWSYQQSTATWDIYYLVFFASFGMAIFSMFVAYGLKTKKEELAEGDEFIDEGKDDDVKFIDEGNGKGKMTGLDLDGENPSRRTRDIRDRASKRRTRWE